MGRRLYIAREQAEALLRELCSAHICKSVQNHVTRYVYQLESSELDSLIGKLASIYSHNLIAITNLIHAQSAKDSRVQQFADAFILRKEKE